jgi:coenzyme F420-0:L-glutamate ligase / coenzyme F420-1:gamma-L-glutamate ligase
MGADFKKDLLKDGMALEKVEAQVERSRSRILEAPVVVLVCLDPEDLDLYPDEKRQKAEYTMAVQSVAMAGSVLLLAAQAEGLGSVWVCSPLFAQGTVRRALSLPEAWDPQGLVLLGFPAKVPEARARLPLKKVVKYS